MTTNHQTKGNDNWTMFRIPRVGTSEPTADDLFVVTAIDGRRPLVAPVSQYQAALRAAHDADAPTRRLTKVLCVSPRELYTLFGISVPQFMNDASTNDWLEFTKIAASYCKYTIGNSRDPVAIADAKFLWSALDVPIPALSLRNRN